MDQYIHRGTNRGLNMRWNKVILILLLIKLFFIVGCDQNNKDLNIEHLVEYAKQFEPCNPDGDCRNLFKTPTRIRNILELHEVTHDYKVSVMLVLLKHYNYEYSSFHQGYELRKGVFHDQSAFVEAYMRIAGGYKGDYMTAYVAYEWVISHPEYLKDTMIAEQIRKIKNTEKIIENM
jgi:hypothetical protein